MKEIGSEFTYNHNADYHFKTISKIGDSVHFLRTGRDAIGFVLDSLPKEAKIVLIPSYCCDSMISPFVNRGWEVRYYPINHDFSIDIRYLLTLINELNPHVILLMNFFGLCDTKSTVVQIKKISPSVKIIEDITHTLFDTDKYFNRMVDYYVGSIRKWIGVPDGAIAISCSGVISDIAYVKNNFVDLRKSALIIKEEYLHTGLDDLKILFRKLLINAEISLENDKTIYSISPDSKEALLNFNVSTLKMARKLNALTLLRKLKNIPQLTLPYNIDIVKDNTPFSIPIFISKRDRVQKALAGSGIYCAKLWPLNKEARKVSSASEDIENSNLSVPIDQRYDFADMQIIADVLKKTLKNY